MISFYCFVWKAMPTASSNTDTKLIAIRTKQEEIFKNQSYSKALLLFFLWRSNEPEVSFTDVRRNYANLSMIVWNAFLTSFALFNLFKCFTCFASHFVIQNYLHKVEYEKWKTFIKSSLGWTLMAIDNCHGFLNLLSFILYLTQFKWK